MPASTQPSHDTNPRDGLDCWTTIIGWFAVAGEVLAVDFGLGVDSGVGELEFMVRQLRVGVSLHQ